MALRSYEDVQSSGPGLLLLVTQAEIAIALKAVADPSFAAIVKGESPRGQECLVMAGALAAHVAAARLPEWQRPGKGADRPTGRILEGEDALSKLLATFGTRNLTRRIWISATDPKAPAPSGNGRDAPRTLRDAIDLSRRRHVQKDLRRARIDAESFAHADQGAVGAKA